jgi:hypothetical protein
MDKHRYGGVWDVAIEIRGGPLRPSEVESPLRISRGKRRQMRVFAS